MADRWATFDCYGTLVDWESGIGGELARLWPGEDADRLRNRYHEIEPRVQLEGSLPYREVLHQALVLLAESAEWCEAARSLGFRGKACVHPDQVEIVNRVFTPSDEELSQARRVVEAYEQAVEEGEGVTALDGEMIDLPVVERARHLLEEAKRSVLHAE